MEKSRIQAVNGRGSQEIKKDFFPIEVTYPDPRTGERVAIQVKPEFKDGIPGVRLGERGELKPIIGGVALAGSEAPVQVFYMHTDRGHEVGHIPSN